MTRYILGELSEDERARIEEKYFAADDAFEQLLAAEDELIDAYVRGELYDSERALFESRFLVTERRRERVAFARELARRGALQPAHASASQNFGRPQSPSTNRRSPFAFAFARRPAFGFALAGMALALLALVVWLVVGRVGREQESANLRAPNNRASENASNQTNQNASPRSDSDNTHETPRPSPPPTAPERASQAPSPVEASPSSNQRSPRAAVVSLVLSPVAVRDAGEPSRSTRLVVPRGTESALLQLNFKTDGDFKSYVATLETVEGREVWKRGSLAARAGASGAKRVSLSVPANVLQTAGYILKVSGTNQRAEDEVVAEFYFSVDKK